MSEKITTMVLKVDLECHSCYKKVKKVFGKFSEIGDQVYDEKANTVTIKVLSCNPEKLMDKIRSKGGKSVVSIEIKKPEKKDAEGKKKEAEKPKTEEKKDDSKPANLAEKPKAGGPQKEGPPPVVAAGYPSSFSIGPPLSAVYVRVGPAPGQNGEYIGRPIYDSYGGENPSACVVM